MRISTFATALFLATLGTSCKSRGTSEVKDETMAGSPTSSGPGKADHECQIVLTEAAWNPLGGGQSSFDFKVSVHADLVPKPQDMSVHVHYALVNGPWEETKATLTPNQPGGDWLTYAAKIPLRTLDRDMQVVAFIETPSGRLFDHNFEAGDTGVVKVSREKGHVANLSPACQAP